MNSLNQELSKEKLIYLSTIPEYKWINYECKKYINSQSNFNFEERNKNIQDVKKILETINLKFWITNGTALAAVREKNWIPWDDDVDLDVLMEDYLKIEDQLLDLFLEKGFIVRKKHVRNKRRAKITIYRGGEKTSIRPLYLDPKFKNNYYRLRNNYKYPKEFYEKEEKIFFLGNEYNIPSPSQKFLEWCYGKNWETPLNSNNDNEYYSTKVRRSVNIYNKTDLIDLLNYYLYKILEIKIDLTDLLKKVKSSINSIFS